MLKNIATEIGQILGGDFEIYFETSLADIKSTDKAVGVFYNTFGDVLPLPHNTGIEASCELDVFIPTKDKSNENKFNQMLAKLDNLIGQANGQVLVSGTTYNYVLGFGVPTPMGTESINYGNFAMGYSIPVNVVMTSTLTFGNTCTITLDGKNLNGVINADCTVSFDLLSVVTANNFKAGNTPQYSDFRLNIDLTLFDNDDLHEELVANALAEINGEYDVVYKPNGEKFSKPFVGVVESFTYKQPLGKFQVWRLVLARKQIFSTTDYTLTLSSTDTSLSVTRNGTPLNNGDTIHTGDVLTINASPVVGHRLTTLTVNGVSVENGDTYIVRGNTTIVAVSMLVEQFTLTLSEGSNTSISVLRNNVALSNGDTIETGDQLVISASADNGYNLTTFTINGVSATGTQVVRVSANVVVVTEATRINASVNLQAYNGYGYTSLTATKIVDNVETQISPGVNTIPVGSKVVIYYTTDTLAKFEKFEILKDNVAVETILTGGTTGSYEITITGNTNIDVIAWFKWAFDLNGGSGSCPDIEANTKTGISIPANYTPTKTPMIFDGWQVGGSGTTYQAGQTYTTQTALQNHYDSSHGSKLVAKWNKVTIYFDTTYDTSTKYFTTVTRGSVAPTSNITITVRYIESQTLHTTTYTMLAGSNSASAYTYTGSEYEEIAKVDVSPASDSSCIYAVGTY